MVEKLDFSTLGKSRLVDLFEVIFYLPMIINPQFKIRSLVDRKGFNSAFEKRTNVTKIKRN